MTENERLRLVRETLQLSQSEMAEVLGMTQAGISNIESGKVSSKGRVIKVSSRVRNALAQKYGISKIWLEDGEGTMFAKPVKRVGDDKDYVIALLEDKIRLLEYTVADKDRIIKLLEGGKEVPEKLPASKKKFRQISDKSAKKSPKKG